jgi:hypothetical protein
MPVFRTVTDAQSGDIKLEAIHQPIYDSAVINAAGIKSFFQNPAGRSQLQTNVATAGQLSWPKRFSIKAFRAVPSFSALATDLLSYFDNTIFRCNVGEKQYLVCPAMLITPGTGLEIQLLTGAAAPLAPANGQNYARHGRPEHRNIYALIHSIYIPPVQNFVVSLEVGAGVSLSANGFTAWVYLEGELLREIQ